MRNLFRFFLCASLTATVGCTHLALERRTVKQASTLTDLQYQQVLDNLAMFACNPEAMPWHAKLKSGTVQIADQGSGGFSADIAAATGGEVTRLIPATGAERGILNQWDVDPTSEAEELEQLTLAYRKAIDPTNPQINDDIDEVIGELCIRFDILPKLETMQRIFVQKHVRYRISRAITDSKEIKNCTNNKMRQEQIEQQIVELNDIDCLVEKVLGPELATVSAAEPVVDSQQLKVQTSVPAGSTWHGAFVPPSPVAMRTDSLLLEGLFGQSGKPRLSSQKEQLLTALQIATDLGYVPPSDLHEATRRNVGLIAQAEDKIKKLQDLVERFNTPWLSCGSKQEMPNCVCYVGRHCGCTGECYVWVMPEQLGKLREFTLVVLALAPVDKQDLFPSGAAFTPSFR